MMAQYIEIKAANPDSLLFYRMGDFYELFFGDAEIAARALGIALTKRGKHLGEDIPMCGVPIHAADDYLQKLIALGHRVAVCEQLEDPAEAKKRGSKAVVRRDVVRLVTPGTITEDNLLDASSASMLVALARTGSAENAEYALAAADISTGAFRLLSTSERRLSADLARLEPREIIVSQSVLADHSQVIGAALASSPAAVQEQAPSLFDSTRAANRLESFFGVSTLDGLGEFSRAELAAAGGIIGYIELTQFDERPALDRPAREDGSSTMLIDAATRANLELTATLSGSRDGSLLQAIDRTVTGGGARLLTQRLAAPLTVSQAIHERLDEVSFWLAAQGERETLRRHLKGLSDLPRALSRLALNRGGPRDLAAIRSTLTIGDAVLGDISDTLHGGPDNVVKQLEALAQSPSDVLDLLTQALAQDLPLHARDGGLVADGYDPQLDEQRALSRESKRVIAGLQSDYAQETGVKALKIRHNNVLGYFIEVTTAQAPALQEKTGRFIHRQTMANAMRFTTTELAEIESKIANAAGRALELELRHFEALREAALAQADVLKAVAQALAQMDVGSALAQLAEAEGYCRPQIDDSRAFSIVAGRHPVVEQALRKQAANPFVANDCHLGHDDTGQLWLLTGPNMGGKSTFLRQNALIALMAQMGSFVPAGSAHIGIVDKLFSRVGAADDLARGRSTFMVEMVETAAILNQAGDRSFVILDEIGRGTATFDGLSIAWAAIEHLHETCRCRTLFATHYHELTALGASLERVANVTMSVKEWDGDVVFLHEVVEGSADRSYGIQVARLAGLPDAVIARARQVLDQLESQNRDRGPSTLIDDLPLFSAHPQQASGTREGNQPLHDALHELHPDDLSPREALEMIYRLKKLAVN